VLKQTKMSERFYIYSTRKTLQMISYNMLALDEIQPTHTRANPV